MDKERKKWRAIIHIIIDVILFLSKQNLFFRDRREDFDSQNQGNFLETVKLIAKYNLVMNDHLSHMQVSKKRMSTYLSPTIQNQLIELLGKKVKNLILKKIKEAAYFSILLDSTPDVSRTDQMAFVVRYVKVEESDAQIKESFLNFFPLRGKTAEEITNSILNELHENGLDMMMCRGQAYDNASTISGIYSGVQRRIKEINSKAIYVPCGNHSLNLAGVHAVGSSKLSDKFFTVVERVYSFFSVSTHRWNALLKHVPIVVKRVIDTRWSAHYESVKALHLGIDGIVSALEELCDQNENVDTRGQAHDILDAIQRVSILSFLHFWKQILRESHDAQKYLQQKGLSLENCAQKMKAFVAFLSGERDALVSQAIDNALMICEKLEIPIEERRVRRKKRMPGEQTQDVGLSVLEEIKRCMLQAVDRFLSEAERRFSGINELNKTFSFLNPHALLQSDNNEVDMTKFKTMYADEADLSELPIEIERFKRLAQSSGSAFQSIATALDVLQWLTERRLRDSTPYLCLCLKFYLTVAVSTASCETSFSKLRLTKSYLRPTTGDDRLSALSILSIESDFVGKLNFDDIISDFASMKARLVDF